MIRRKNEKVLWQAWSRDNGGFHRVSQAGKLEGSGICRRRDETWR